MAYMLSICKIKSFWAGSCIGEVLPIFFPVNLCKCLGKNQLHVVSTRLLLVLLAMIMTTTSH
jgi:uncharacterized membrane protein YdjX (TVP38/TMEM64 family)